MPDNEFEKRIRGYFTDLKKIYRKNVNENTDYAVEIKEYLDKIESTDDLCALHYYMNKIVLPLLENNAAPDDVFSFNEIGTLIQYTGLVIESRKDFKNKNEENNDEPTKTRG